ncbi:MAG: hypothetical protein WCV90_08485 [Candidatus Woesearchaeota archaeon]
MAYFHHRASYSLGDRLLNSTDRVVVGTRDPGAKEDRRVARHLGLSSQHPTVISDHRLWSDEEYLPVFNTKRCLTDRTLSRFLSNYQDADGQERYGYGLKGKTVYIVHTFSTQYSPQDLVKRVEFIAETAKEQGAEAVVLLAYSLNYSAQERGVHKPHPRMTTPAALKKFDGQGITARMQLKHYLVAGVDAVITAHNHCPDDIADLCNDVNEEFAPLNQIATENNWNMRYKLKFYNVNLAPMFGLLVSDFGESHLGLDISDKGRNILFLGPDKGVEEYIRSLRDHSGLTNSALAIMDKKRAADGKSIDLLQLYKHEGIDLARGIEGMDIVVADDAIRSGETMRNNLQVLRGIHLEGLVRDPIIKGSPRKVVAMATRTNFAGNSRLILESGVIDDLVITNADPRGLRNLNELDRKTMGVWINFVMGEAGMALERGEDPDAVLTTSYIRDHQLMHIEVPHGHYRFTDREPERGIF